MFKGTWNINSLNDLSHLLREKQLSLIASRSEILIPIPEERSKYHDIRESLNENPIKLVDPPDILRLLLSEKTGHIMPRFDAYRYTQGC